jgi:hypothetical protein
MKMIVLFFSILTVLTASAAINDQDRAKLLSEVNLLPNPGFEASTGGWTASARYVFCYKHKSIHG